MGQCEKILDNGERCSNQAVPGMRFCAEHGRISFRKVQEAEAADTAPPPPAEKEKTPPDVPPVEEEEERAQRAVPSPLGETPIFPGLRSDDRNILVAPRGVIWLTCDREDAIEADCFTRLVRALGMLSQAIDLHPANGAPQVRILRREETEEALIFLLPAEPEAGNLSTFYDAASTAARLVKGRLYIGDRLSFIQYRDDGAPRGYDAPSFPSSRRQDDDLLLVAHWGSRRLALDAFHEASLADFAMQVAPAPETTAAALATAYALVDRSLYAVLARYFRAHHLRYRLARLQRDGRELILFQIQPNPETAAERVIPPFILAYLRRMPRVTVLRDVSPGERNTILLQWRRRYPLHLPHISGTFASESMVILTGDEYGNMQVHPMPLFLDGDRLTDVYTDQGNGRQLAPQPADDVPALRLPILLRPDPGPIPPVAALILTGQEVGWVRQLLYRLPGDAFAQYRICQGKDRSILVGESLPIEGIPFGLPLRRLADTELFLPLRSRFVPALPWPILRQALDVQTGVYTFLTKEYRLDVAEEDFQPLSRTVMAQQRGMTLQVKPPATLPSLEWQPRRPARGEKLPSERPAEEETPPEKAPWWDRWFGGAGEGEEDAMKPRPPAETLDVSESAPAPVVVSEEGDVDDYLREQAQQYEETGDMLAAALCYELMDDEANSSRCYQAVMGK
jgi:hypothetical protein